MKSMSVLWEKITRRKQIRRCSWLCCSLAINAKIEIKCEHHTARLTKRVDPNQDNILTLKCQDPDGILRDEFGKEFDPNATLPTWRDCETVCRDINIPKDKGYMPLHHTETLAGKIIWAIFL